MKQIKRAMFAGIIILLIITLTNCAGIEKTLEQTEKQLRKIDSIELRVAKLEKDAITPIETESPSAVFIERIERIEKEFKDWLLKMQSFEELILLRLKERR